MRPLRTSPRLVSPVWGGTALARKFRKGDDRDALIGESWEVWRDNALLDGSGATLGDTLDFPLLVKLLDTRASLSVQVHPDDAQAARLEGAPNGKAEGWVVLAAEPGARIAYGLRNPLTPEQLRERARSGAIADDLDWREVFPGQVYDVPPGTIHAIGGGLTLYEIQQPSDLTYRLYDYGRDRELHLDKAVEVAITTPAGAPLTPVPVGPGRTRLISGAAFVLERWALPALPHVTLDRPHALTVIDGEALIGDDAVAAGDTVVLPAGRWALTGWATCLVGSVPDPT